MTYPIISLVLNRGMAKMRIKQGFMLREVANNFIVVPVGKASEKFRGLITLNSTGAFLWRNLEQETTKDEIEKNC